MLIIALPVAILGNNFQDVYKEKQESRMIEAIKKKIIEDQGLATEEQKEVHFMNERLMNIESCNKKILSILNGSDAKYKELTSNLKRLYKGVHKESGLNEIMKEQSERTSFKSDLESRISMKKKINRVKQKIKVSNLFSKIKEAAANLKEDSQEKATMKAVESHESAQVQKEIRSVEKIIEESKEQKNQAIQKENLVSKMKKFKRGATHRPSDSFEEEKNLSESFGSQKSPTEKRKEAEPLKIEELHDLLDEFEEAISNRISESFSKEHQDNQNESKDNEKEIEGVSSESDENSEKRSIAQPIPLVKPLNKSKFTNPNNPTHN